MVTIWREKENLRPSISILLSLIWVSVQTFLRKKSVFIVQS